MGRSSAVRTKRRQRAKGITTPVVPAASEPSRSGVAWSYLSTIPLAMSIVLAPVVLKVPLGPVALSPSDLLLAVAVVLGVPRILGLWREQSLWVAGAAPLAVLFCCALSAAGAADGVEAVKELAQLALYIGGGVWLLTLRSAEARVRRLLGWAVAGAFGLAAMGGILHLGIGFVRVSAVFGAPSTLSTSVLAWCALARWFVGAGRGRLRSAVAVLAIASLASLAVAARVDTTAPRTRESVPQRYLEAYAGLSVLSSSPLTGVGLGNYQQHIGEYYQGMPKDNTLPPGSGVGYIILLASAGLPALAAWLYWLHVLWRRASGTRLRPAVAAVCVGGLLSPLFVGSFLLPLITLHGIVHGEERRA